MGMNPAALADTRKSLTNHDQAQPLPSMQLCKPERASLGSCRDICGLPGIAPQIRAPYYGLLFTQMAITGLPNILLVWCTISVNIVFLLTPWSTA